MINILIRKKALFLPAALLLLLGLSCEQKETVFEGPYHVRFTSSDTTVRESYTKPIRIKVHHAGPQISQTISIKYLISGNAREGIDYKILGKRGEVEIPANQSFGYIILQLINNANNILESQDIVFTLADVQPTNLRIGFGNAEIGRIMRFTILDDCILSGRYIGSFKPANSTATSLKSGITITSTDCRRYRVSNWDIDIFDFPSTRDIEFIDNEDNTITIPEQEEQTLPQELATIKGTGSINPQNGYITLNIVLVDFENSPVATVVYRPE